MTAGQIIVAVSVVGGIIGGMGMGGGTLLIPLLTFAAGMEQHLAQSINLMAFIPMSGAALFIHKKNGYVDVKMSLPIMSLALIGAVCGSLAAGYSGGHVLRMSYGVFLIALGIYQFVKTVYTFVKTKKAKQSDGTRVAVRQK